MMRTSMILALALAGAAGCNRGPKRTEAEVNLERLGKTLKEKFASTGGFPTGRVGPSPAATCCNTPDHKCDDPSAWQLPLWKELGFAVEGKHDFMYSYEGSPTQFTATATADLNCDDQKRSQFVLAGTVENKQVVITWQKPTVLD